MVHLGAALAIAVSGSSVDDDGASLDAGAAGLDAGGPWAPGGGTVNGARVGGTGLADLGARAGRATESGGGDHGASL